MSDQKQVANKRLYSTGDAIRVTGLSQSTILKYERDGVFRAQRLPGDRRVLTPADIKAILTHAKRNRGQGRRR